MSELRAFAKKINRNLSPAEARQEAAALAEHQRRKTSLVPGDAQFLGVLSANADRISIGSNGTGLSSGVSSNMYGQSGTSHNLSYAASPNVDTNFEDLLTSRLKEIEADKEKSMLLVPDDDVTVEKIPKIYRTVRPPVPINYKSDQSDAIVASCVDSYNSDFNVAKFKYGAYSQKTDDRLDDFASVNSSLSDRLFEIDEKERAGAPSGNSMLATFSPSSLLNPDDIRTGLGEIFSNPNAPIRSPSPKPGDRNSMKLTAEDIVKSEFAGLESETLHPELLKFAGAESDAANMRARTLNRQRLLALQHESEIIAQRQRSLLDRPEPSPDVFTEKFGTRFILSCNDLSFKLEDMEPFFCSVALYDAGEKKKISETFNFELNKFDIIQMVESFIGPRDVVTESKKAVFSVSEPNSEVYLVARIDKVLNGDIGEAAEPYISLNDKNSSKTKQAVATMCSRLGGYRMPFAWSAMPIFSNKGELECQGGSEDLVMRMLFRQESEKLSDDDLFKHLAEFKKGTIQKKLKVIPGSISFSIQLFEEMPMGTFTPSLVPLVPSPAVVTSAIREVEEFPVRSQYSSHNTYVHNLYLYPLSLNFNNRGATVKARNLAVKVEVFNADATDPSAKPLKIIYGKAPGAALVSSILTPVTYHNKAPEFYDEFKISLPARLSENYHFLFTIYHVSCQLPKKPGQVEPVETIVGYAFLPLLRSDGRINSIADQTLPVSSNLAANYLADSAELKWIDGKKPLFKIATKLCSTVAPQSLEIHQFIVCSRQPSASEDHLLQSLRHLIAKAEGSETVQFATVILNQLFSMLVRPNISEQLSREVFKCLVHIVLLCHKDSSTLGRSTALHAYVAFHFVNPALPSSTKTIFEEIFRLWMAFLRESDPTNSNVVTDLLKHSWFFFDICIKSMILHIAASKKLDKPRKDRLPSSVNALIRGLVELLTVEIQKRSKSGQIIAKRLNQFLAFFLRDCLSVLDRGAVFSIIHRHALETAPNDSHVLLDFKLEFIRIICNYEHYVALNLPTVPKAYNERLLSLTEEYCERHFLASLILTEVYVTMDHEEKTHRKKAISVLRDLLAKLDADERYQTPERRARIAALHFPIIQIVLDHSKRLTFVDNGVSASTPAASAVTSGGTITGNSSSNNSPLDGSNTLTETSSPAIGNTSTIGRNTTLSFSPYPQAPDSLDFDESRELLLCFLHVVKDCDRELVRFWWKTNKDFTSRLQYFMEVLEKCVLNFEFVGKRRLAQRISAWISRDATHDAKRVFEETYSSMSQRVSGTISSGGVSSPRPSVRDRSFGGSGGTLSGTSGSSSASALAGGTGSVGGSAGASLLSGSLNQNGASGSNGNISGSNGNISGLVAAAMATNGSGDNDAMLRRYNTTKRGVANAEPKLSKSMDVECKVEGNLSFEVGLTILDLVEDYIQQNFESISSMEDGHNEMLERVFRLLMSFLRTNQDKELHLHLFASLRSFLHKFPGLFFQGVTDFCAELVGEVLKLCNSMFASTRTQATAFLYLLMKKNFQSSGNFSRVKVQSTIALSRIVGSSLTINDTYLQKVFATVAEYAMSDKDKEVSGLAEQVRDLATRLYTILRDTVKMKVHEKDSDMLIDLQYRLAKGYANSPDLRVTWLENIAQLHFERKNWAEAAQCIVHQAALVAEYLNVVEFKRGLPLGCAAFHRVSSNVAEEAAVSEDAQSADEEGVCESKNFSEQGLVALLEKAILYLRKAELLETANEVYKLVLPIYEKNRQFEKIAAAHDTLSAIFLQIVAFAQSGKRRLGSYFRVGFYGDRFGELDGKEFIYKEPKITHLSEICPRLSSFYRERFGEKNFELIQDSTDVDVAKLDPNKAYVQVTFVAPYFSEYELKDRVTYFELNNNINKFIFDTPFTESGKAHGSVEDQKKRKTILIVENFFPYIKKRLLVVERQIVILSPIEVAIEEIQQKAAELSAVVQNKPTNVKMLQMLLQGSVSATVNSGPLEMAQVFLGKLAKDLPIKQVRKLRQHFRDFVKYSGQALALNETLIKPDQLEYQKDLTSKYKDLKAKLSPFISKKDAGANSGDTDSLNEDSGSEQINKVLTLIGSREGSRV